MRLAAVALTPVAARGIVPLMTKCIVVLPKANNVPMALAF